MTRSAILSITKKPVAALCRLRGVPAVDWCQCGVLALAAVLLFSRLDDRDLWPSHEARAGQNARHFLDTGEWGVPRLLDGTPDYQKPPLYYWLVAGTARILARPVDAWAVRLPAAAAGWLTVVAVVTYLRSRGRPLAAVFAGSTLLTACHFLAIARTGRIDVPLTAAVTIAILIMASGACERSGTRPNRGVPTPRSPGVFDVGAATACVTAAALLKGPIGVVLCVTVVGANAVLSGRRESLRAVGITSLVACAIAAPWFVVASVQTGGEFTRVFFWHHHVDRAAGAAGLAGHPEWFYPARWLIDWLPWSPALAASLWFTVRRRWWHDADIRLGLVWVISVTAVLSASRFKRADYLIPAYPGAAILLGCSAERLFRVLSATVRRRFLTGFAATLGTSLVVYVAIQFTVIPTLDRTGEKRTVAFALRQLVPPRAQVIFFRVEDHLLAFHLGKPLATVLEWENLNVWAARLDVGFVLMPAGEAELAGDRISAGELRELARFPDRTVRTRPRDLVLLESRPRRAVLNCDHGTR